MSRPARLVAKSPAGCDLPHRDEFHPTCSRSETCPRSILRRELEVVRAVFIEIDEEADRAGRSVIRNHGDGTIGAKGDREFARNRPRHVRRRSGRADQLSPVTVGETANRRRSSSGSNPRIILRVRERRADCCLRRRRRLAPRLRILRMWDLQPNDRDNSQTTS